MKKPRMSDEPDRAVADLPSGAQEMYLEAFNEAWHRYGRSPRDRSRAHAVAWAVIKQHYHEVAPGEWKEGAADQPLPAKPLDDRRIF